MVLHAYCRAPIISLELILCKAVGYCRMEILYVSEPIGGATTQHSPHLVGTREACKAGARPFQGLALRAETGFKAHGPESSQGFTG